MGIGNTQIYADLAKDLHRLGGSYGCCCSALEDPGLSSLGVPGVPWHPQILADELTLLSQSGRREERLCQPNNTCNPGFSALPMAQQSYDIMDR